MEIVRASSLWRDLKSIIDYFDGVHEENVALRFLGSLDDTINFIEEFPDLGNPWESDNPRHAGIRFRLVKGFENYLVLYRLDDQRVCLLRVLHGSQNIETHLG